MSEKRSAVCCVTPVAGRWVVRTHGRRAAESYDRLEDALVAAEALVGRWDPARRPSTAAPRGEDELGATD